LELNIEINHLEDIITPINGDSNNEVSKLSQAGIKADRIIMGVFPAPVEYVENALTVAKKNTIVHYEGVAGKDDYLNLYEQFSTIANENEFKCELLDHRFVKSYGPHLYHVVFDIQVH
jgi:tRNA G37 N-methylase Trm5